VVPPDEVRHSAPQRAVLAAHHGGQHQPLDGGARRAGRGCVAGVGQEEFCQLVLEEPDHWPQPGIVAGGDDHLEHRGCFDAPLAD
jgi:hypothetical protein